jgi:hypothetical protein
MFDQVTVVIPHIPVRKFEITRAIASVTAQTRQPDDVIVSVDVQHLGSANTRNRALKYVATYWTAFLDDDDELDENHLETLLEQTQRVDAQVFYSGCRVIDSLGNSIPLLEEWGRFGNPFNAELLRQKSYIPVTSLVRTDFARLAGFGPPQHIPDSPYDDWGFYLRLLDMGAKFVHVPEITWTWHHHGNNTSGQAGRW